jgi:leucyl-tRNA synthetase
MRTMSKSKNNGVDPTTLVEQYGADSIRLFMMFKSPPEDTLEWSGDGVEGAARFMRRLWKMVYEHLAAGQPGAALDPDSLDETQRDVRRAAHATLAKVTDDMGRRRVFNTAIAAVMEFMNILAKFDDSSPQGRAVTREALELLVQILSPIIPHACHALWQALGHEDGLIDRAWPKPDPRALLKDSVEIVVQVNGKLRGRVVVPADANEEQIRAAALASPSVNKWVEGKPVRKIIVVKGKLANIVVQG